MVIVLTEIEITQAIVDFLYEKGYDVTKLQLVQDDKTNKFSARADVR